MKNCKGILLVAVAVLLCMPAFAQKSARKMAKETAEMVTKLDEKQQKMILNYSRNLAKVDVKKEMKKTLKKMSPEERQKVMDYIAKVESGAAMEKAAVPVAKVKPTVPPAPAKKAKKEVKEANKFVMKNDPTAAPTTKVEVLDKTFDFGTIKQGEKASTVYRVKNVGDNPLIISKAKGSCGCTVPQWPKEAIAPGEIAEIKVVFNSRGKKGKQNKRITLTANTDPVQTFMTITGMVEMPDNAKPVQKKQ